MILTDSNISQRKIVETPQFVFKPTNIDLIIEKYYFCDNNQTPSFQKIARLNILKFTSIFIKSFNKLTAEIKPT